LSIANGYHSVLLLHDNSSGQDEFYIGDQAATGRGYIPKGFAGPYNGATIDNWVKDVTVNASIYYNTYGGATQQGQDSNITGYVFALLPTEIELSTELKPVDTKPLKTLEVRIKINKKD
jgi:hypothetical protein